MHARLHLTKSAYPMPIKNHEGFPTKREKKAGNPTQKWAKDLNRPFTERKWPIRTCKDALLH